MHVRKPPDFIEPAAGRTELTSGRGPSHPLRSLGAVDRPPRRLTFRSPMERLRLVPLDDTVVFPSMTVTLPVDVGHDDRVFVVPRHGGDYASVGVVAEVVDRVRLPGGGRAVVLSGLHRGVAGAARNDPAGHLVVEVEAKPDETPPRSRTAELEREYRAVVLEILELRGDDGRVAAFLRSITEPGALADTSGYSPDLSFAQKVELLGTLGVVERLELALRLQRERLAELQVRKRIRDDAESGAQKQQRDYILRRQLDSIRKELGEDETSVADEYRKKIADAGMPDAVRKHAERELGRLERMGESSPESSMIRSYLDWLLAVPWAKRSEERLDPVHAREVLDADTMNPVIMLDEVDKVGADWRGDPSSALLEVLDPAQNHAFRDHYLDVELDLSHVLFIATANVGDTIPGPLVDRMEVIRFDGYTVEEKLAIARGFLWPRQVERNGLRPDEVGIDDAVVRTVIIEYTREAGVRQLERELGRLLRKTATRIAAGAATAPVAIDPAVAHEALGRPKFFQESAERTAVPGVATGLAVTPTGGDVLFVEAAAMAGGDGLVLTGQLGDVMKESARIALTWVRSHAADLGIDERAFRRRQFHVHVPAGAIPKDGPSAGVTMVTALASLLTERAVKHNVGMTGEVTLRGRVLPIGGVKQKVLAAHAAGLTDVILPERNRGDLDEVPAEVQQAMRFHLVSSVDEVLALALEKGEKALAA